MFDQGVQLKHQQFVSPLYLRTNLTSHLPHFTICCIHKLKPDKPNGPLILVNLVDFPFNFLGFFFLGSLGSTRSPKTTVDWGVVSPIEG